MDIPQLGPCALIVLFSYRSRQVNRKVVEMFEDGAANLLVRGASRPQVRRCSAGNARHAPERRRAKLLVFCHEKLCPVPNVRRQPVEFSVQLVVPRDFSVSLLDVLHHVDDLTQDSVESSDRIVRWWRERRLVAHSPRTAMTDPSGSLNIEVAPNGDSKDSITVDTD